MEQFCHPLPINNSWKFWKKRLLRFIGGCKIVYEMETFFPQLINECPDSISHMETSDRLTYVGHPLQYFNNDNLTLDKEDNIICVQVGSSEYQIVDYQNLFEWIERQKHYMDTYSMLKDLKTFNFVSDKMCPILQTLKNYLDEVNDSGFVVKGYNFVNHFCLFKQGVFAKDVFNDSYFCFLANDNVVLYLTKCSKEAYHVLHHSLRNVKIANILHGELQSNNIIQINVIIHNETNDSTEFCKQCIDNDLFVNEDTFTDAERFTLWYNKLKENIHNKINQPNDLLMTGNEICNVIKKDMITYQALETRNLPSFGQFPEDQMDELNKLVVLSPTQFKALHSDKKHILLRGSYGCGKSLVLFKKFELIVNNMIDSEIAYLICNDQQSEFIHQMKIMQYEDYAKYPMKNIVICRSDQLMPGAKIIPKLSCILNHIKHVWKNRTVHILIDELNGSYFNNSEIEKLKNILHHFQNSYIVIALQSMEQNIVRIENKNKFSDFGYQFSKLTEETSFTLYNLDYSLRNSSEINEFVKATVSILESSKVPVAEEEHFSNYHKVIVDSESGMEYSDIDLDKEATMVTTYKYNQNDSVGHEVKSGLVNIYHCSSKNLDERKERFIVYLSILEYILKDLSEINKYVICTYDKDLYDAVQRFLATSLHKWTYHINDFMQPRSIFTVFVTNNAVVRGYEFNNFIFLAPFGKRFLKYRMVECFTRCTTRLHVISDDINVTSDSIDRQLIIKWKELNCAYFIDCSYDKSADKVLLLHGDTEIYCKENATKVYSKPSTYRSLCTYPWDIRVIQVKDISNVQDDIFIGLRYIVSMDNIRLLNDFINLHNTDIRTYRDIDDQNLLHIASEYDAVCISQILINDYKIDVNWTDKYKRTPLHLATDHGSTNTVDILIRNGADVNVKNEDGNTPLYISSYRGYANIVQLLLNNGTYVNLKNINDETPLHISSYKGHINIVQLLLDNGADINAKDKYNDTPLHDSSRKGNINIVKLLLDNGTDVNAKDKYNNTALHKSSSNGHRNIVQLLLDNGSDVNAKDKDNDTPLHEASRTGHINIVQLLLNNGADVNVKNKDNDTPLHESSRNEHINIVQLLLNNGADVNVKNKDNDTPLYESSRTGHINIVQVLLKNGADVSVKNEYNNTPLHISSRGGHISIVQLLLNNGADVNVKDEDNDTPLHESLCKRNINIVQLLLNNGADVNVKNKYNNTPLHISSRGGNINIVQLFLNNGADVNAKDKDNDTPLHESSRKGHINIVQLLLDNGAYVNVKNKDGCAAIDLAQHKHHEDIVELLKRYK